MSKMTDRLQVLIPNEMRKRLERARGTGSVGPIVREALDQHLTKIGLPEKKKGKHKNFSMGLTPLQVPGRR